MHKETVVNQIEVLENGFIQVRRGVYFVDDDGQRTLINYHRVAYAPGDQIPDEVDKVQRISEIAWTPDVVQKHRDRVEADKVKRNRS